MFCFVGLLSAIREIFFTYFAEEEKIQQNGKQNAEIREFSARKRKLNVVNNDPYPRIYLTLEYIANMSGDGTFTP